MPIMNDQIKVIIYLEEWQKQMVNDFLGIDDCQTYTFDVPSVPHPSMKYGVWTNHKCKRMYFTEWQKREIQDETGVDCNYVELCPGDVRAMYMAPTSFKK